MDHLGGGQRRSGDAAAGKDSSSKSMKWAPAISFGLVWYSWK